MLEFVQKAIQWLKEGSENEAADILSKCAVEIQNIDYGTAIGAGPDVEMYWLTIRAPRKIWQNIDGVYKGARDDIYNSLQTCLAPEAYIVEMNWQPKLPDREESPTDEIAHDRLATVDSYHVRDAWSKAQKRKKSDPDGAITSARSLLEAVCKRILDDCRVRYDRSNDLPHLYKLVAETMRLAPSQTSNDALRRIFGGCISIIGGMASLRNELGDAHGRGTEATGPSEAHAALAVDLAGTMASFLLSTWEAERPS